jgi:acyl transferase domain-containing protein/2-polyprenyl-3-methyl-5-hydroxy-6-metoxy-1,4-benzoquinol methylase
VNSLGYGGTNAHVILENADTLTYRPNGYTNGTIHGHANGQNGQLSGKWHVFTFSGKDEEAVHDMIANTSSYLESRKDVVDEAFLDNLAYTLGQRRSAFRWVQAFPADSADVLIKVLGGRKPISTRRAEAPRVGFVFTGQGAQWHAMGRELIDAYPVFKRTMQQADGFLKTQGCPWSLIEELNRDAKSTQVNTATIGQPLCTAIQIGLVKLLESWNIRPTAVTGHSSGEIASAYAAGALNLESAMMAAYHRGAIAQKSAKLTGIKGSMIAVGLSRNSTLEYIQRLTSGKVVVACVNSPSNVTVSGDLAAIEELQTLLDADGVFARRLKVATAYHSHHMLLAMDGYLDQLQEMQTADQLSDVLCISSVTGQPIRSAKELGPSYWVQNAVQPVLFSDALMCLCRGGLSEKATDVKPFVDILIEVGPHGALAAPIRQILQAPSLQNMSISYLSCLMRNQDARESMQILASSLLLKGSHVNLGEINFPNGSQTAEVIPDLPSYPWSHKTRYWHEPRINRQQRQRPHGRHDLLGVLSPGQNPSAPTWRHFVRLSDQPWVKDHVVDSNILYPAAGFIAMAIEAVSQTNNSLAAETAGYRVHEMKITNALVVPETSDGVEVQLSLFPSNDQLPRAQRSYEFRILSVGDNDEWHEHCTGRIGLEVKSVVSESNWKQNFIGSSLATAFSFSEQVCTQAIDTKHYYDSVRRVGISYGESFQNLVQISQGPLRSLATVAVRDTATLMPAQIEHPHIIHPTTLDAIFQSVYPALSENGIEHKSIVVPTSIKSLFVSQNISSTPGSRLRISTNAELNTSNGAKASLAVVCDRDVDFAPVVEIEELVLSSVGTSAEEMKNESGDLCFKVSFDKDISFMTPSDFSALSEITMDPSELKVAADLQRACFHIVERALNELTDADRASFADHHLAMFNWMMAQHKLGQSGQLDSQDAAWLDSSDEEQDRLISAVESETVNGEMCVRVGKHLVQMLRKQIEPLEVMMQDRLLYKYYENALGMKRIYSHMSDILRLFAHKNPGANILEIGGGTGGCTVPALRALTGDDDGIPRFAHYDFTDISSGFFENAREKLIDWEDRLGFKKFDVEVDAESQDVECGKYDLVIACNVLHATANMDKTMSNVRKLLRPGGKLLIVEGTRDTLDISLVFGVLPGWWLGMCIVNV